MSAMSHEIQEAFVHAADVDVETLCGVAIDDTLPLGQSLRRIYTSHSNFDAQWDQAARDYRLCQACNAIVLHRRASEADRLRPKRERLVELTKRMIAKETVKMNGEYADKAEGERDAAREGFVRATAIALGGELKS